MFSLSSLIDFLLSLLRDEDAQAEFERDPQAVLARHNLEGVTAQDIRDVQPMLADCDGVTYRDDDGGGYTHAGYGRPARDHGDDDPVRVIHHVTKTHHVERETVVREKHSEHHHQQVEYKQIEYKQYNTEFHYTDNSVHVEEGGTYIEDSFNQDNDGVDNKGGVIDDSNVVVGDENTVGNTEETTTVTDSFDEDHSETVVIVDSANDSSDNSTTVQGSGNDSSINTSYDVNAPAAAAAQEAEAVADPAA